jgi:peptidoglycan/LPS O-acetylase OafA/YrhL
MKYRPDIDGLRAVAVLSVVAEHAGIVVFRGGYIGVDIFFVISGYLIGHIIWSEVEEKKFSIFSFWERRVRRIFPALVAMLATTFIAGYVYLMPLDFREFSRSLIASVFSVSNFYFWFESDYFEPAAQTRPLLHTWTLAVEEQFYIFLPLLLIMIHRVFPNRTKSVITIAAVLSFSLSAIEVELHKSAAFYLLHSRSWELLLGVLVAIGTFPLIRNASVRNGASLIGLVLIAVSIFTYTSATPFPGPLALVPVLGTALIIHAGSSGPAFVNRVLSIKPMTFIGVISYSIYLWHWPIIVFQRSTAFLLADNYGRPQKVILILLSIAVAAISWRFIEQPFRDRRRFSRPLVFAGAAACAGVLFALGAVTTLKDGFAGRFDPKVNAIASFLHYDPDTYMRSGTCFLENKSLGVFNAASCLRIDAEKDTYLLVGDSYAAHLWYGFSKVFQDANILQATATGCKPTIENAFGSNRRCVEFINYIFSKFIPSTKLRGVLIAASWYDTDLSRLDETLSWAKSRGVAVTLFGPMVQYELPLPLLLANSLRTRDPGLPDRNRAAAFLELDQKMAALAARHGVRYVSFFKLLCSNEICQTYATTDIPLQFDIGHLTEEGSVVVARLVQGMGGLVPR